MNSIISQMLEPYRLETKDDYSNALKEVVQEIALSALAGSDFFDHAAFYGGTALRIFYGLDRFSEDLDFSLMWKEDFSLDKYFNILEETFRLYGMNFTDESKEKGSDSFIQSAFLKGGTLEHMIMVGMGPELSEHIQKNEVIKIKFETDVNPPAMASYEYRYRLLPSPCKVRLYDKPSLFAGKLHAVLARNWRNRFKGRDLYDYLYYIGTKTPVNYSHLRERLIESGKMDRETELTPSLLRKMLLERFAEIDFENAKQDVVPFVKDAGKLNLWCREFFASVTNDYFQSIE